MRGPIATFAVLAALGVDLVPPKQVQGTALTGKIPCKCGGWVQVYEASGGPDFCCHSVPHCHEFEQADGLEFVTRLLQGGS